jgi:hypothetical protein
MAEYLSAARPTKPPMETMRPARASAMTRPLPQLEPVTTAVSLFLQLGAYWWCSFGVSAEWRFG